MNPKLKHRGPTAVETSTAEMESQEKVTGSANNIGKVINGKSEPAVQRKTSEEEETVQRKEKGKGGAEVSSGFQSSVMASKGTGNKMDVNIQSSFGAKFGADFGNVKIHNNSRAHQLAQEVNAKAFTVGDDIYFNKGEYQPGTDQGKRLLAHELTHTIQQKRSDNSIQRAPKYTREATTRTPAETCEGKEDVTTLLKELVTKGPGIIDASKLSDDEKAAKKLVFQKVFESEGIFNMETFTFLACDKINIPELSGAVPPSSQGAGFAGYSSAVDKEIGGLKTLKMNIESFLNEGDMHALLAVLKLIAHESRHLTLTGMPEVGDGDIDESVSGNPAGLSTYLVEEILVNAEEIAVNHKFENGGYVVPLELSQEIHRYWNKIKVILNADKVEEMRTYIIGQLNVRYSSKKRSNTITVGILNAMERGNWNQSPRTD